jgi:hypothetical protein
MKVYKIAIENSVIAPEWKFFNKQEIFPKCYLYNKF